MKISQSLLVCIATATSACAWQGPPSYGIDFATIGAAGNRAATADEAPDMQWRTQSVGAVGYEYRLSRTEITNTQYFEFVQAYAPFHTGSPNDGGLTGNWIVYLGNGQYRMDAGSENWPATLSWHMAARFCNWLHNGKVNTAAAFAQGAYDTTTFTRNPNNTWNDNREHSPDARFWIPSLDEWVKGAYFDPNKNGVGGYWTYPGMSDVPLISGPPGVGQTSAGDEVDRFLPFDVGSYPLTLSPWGLLDVSGGMQEWLGGQLLTGPNSTNTPWYKGSRVGQMYGTTDSDRIDWIGVGQPQFGNYGLRIAGIVPSPSTLCPCAVVLVMALGRTTRRTQT